MVLLTEETSQAHHTFDACVAHLRKRTTQSHFRGSISATLDEMRGKNGGISRLKQVSVVMVQGLSLGLKVMG